MKKSLKIWWGVFLLVVAMINVVAYQVEVPNNIVHQYLTNESQAVWSLMPTEMERMFPRSLIALNNQNDYHDGKTIINGSSEEDYLIQPRLHFWQPDDPRTYTAYYNDGIGQFRSSYRRALDLWTTRVIPSYIRGDINESYYWLGRVAHLLEDASQPSHVLLDPHLIHSDASALDDSILEEYTSDNFPTLRSTQNWTGSNFRGQQYNYENLPNMSGFNWDEVDPPSAIDRQNIELFRLFWYTAQKTQYYASDDVDGNNVYYTIDGVVIYEA